MLLLKACRHKSIFFLPFYYLRIKHTFLLLFDGNFLSILAPPNDFWGREAIGPARHVDILIFTHRHRRRRTLNVQNIWWHCGTGAIRISSG